MADTTGKVALVKVNATADSNFGMVQVLDASTVPPTPEIFFLWFTPAERSVATGPEWLMRAMQVSLFREALTAGKTVTVVHDDTSAFITSMQINDP